MELLSDEMKLEQIFSTNPDDHGVYYPSVEGHLVMEWRSKVIQLEKRDALLTAFEQAGVDNWSGCSYAYEILEESV